MNYLCSLGGAGQRAFSEGLLDVGFVAVDFAGMDKALADGGKVLVNGWLADYTLRAVKHPGQIVALWHTGLLGSDLLGEGVNLSEVLDLAEEGVVKLMWLEERDAVPGFVHRMVPFWSPGRLRALVPNPALCRRSGHVVAGLHGAYPSHAKAALINIWGAATGGAHVHCSRSVVGTNTPSAAALRALMGGYSYTAHGDLTRREVVALAAACQLVVHATISDTWPFLVLEAIYAGTPVIVSHACNFLPLWGTARPSPSDVTYGSGPIAKRVREMLVSPRMCEDVAGYQMEAVEKAATGYHERACEALRQVGFAL